MALGDEGMSLCVRDFCLQAGPWGAGSRTAGDMGTTSSRPLAAGTMWGLFSHPFHVSFSSALVADSGS